jgi:beta-N-acetylhexosaminidase
MKSTLRQAAGSLLIVGLGGTELTDLERAWLRLVAPGGIILFKRNIETVAQTRTLLAEATGFAAPYAGRFVDVEGGTVNRLRDALAPIPSVHAVAAAMHTTGKHELAQKHGELIAKAVRAFGFNATFAPVLDLALSESVEILGSRTASADMGELIGYALGFLAGLSENAVASCGKHFPGLGGAASDTHFVTPAIHRTMKQMAADLEPYEALHDLLPLIMTNHAAYPETPAGNTPASASRYWISTVLRKRIGYQGLIVTDDLEMGGILKFMPIEDAVIEAFRAGSDLFLICHSPELILRAYEILLKEAERSASFRTLLLERAARVQRQRARIFAAPIFRPLTEKQYASLQTRIARFSEQIAAGENAQEKPRQSSPAEAS